MTIEMQGTSSRRANVFHRDTIVKMLQAALDASEYRFARQAALSWLAAFPGDLEITLLQAQAVVAEGKPAQVIPALDLVCRKDPFYLEAQRTLAWASHGLDNIRYMRAKTSAYVLGERIPEDVEIEGWGKALRQSYQLLETGQFTEAASLAAGVLRLEPDNLLAQALHLLSSRQIEEPQVVYRLADGYHANCPDCLIFSLVLAEAHLNRGAEPEAVRLLHLGAAGDSTGQVARRLWGDGHRYSSLWPEDLVILFDQPVPAGVAGRLGWNRLAAGEIVQAPPVEEDTIPNGESKKGKADPDIKSLMSALDILVDPEAVEAVEEDESGEPAETEDAEVEPAEDELTEDTSSETEEDPSTDELAEGDVAETADEGEGQAGLEEPEEEEMDAHSAVRKEVEVELEKLARNLKQPALAKADGRFPIYVIFSSQQGLVQQFGPQTAAVLDGELRRLAAVIGKRPGWRALIFYPDDANCMSLYGLTPVNPCDPWKLKHSLSDLDAALAKQGEMVGALLIVGGDSVVPFHRLPNPAEDSDGEIPSDNPYATLDANYFVPEWPVGRLPGENGSDAAALLMQIRQAHRFHSQRAKGKLSDWTDLMFFIKSMFTSTIGRLFHSQPAPSFGYTAAVWRRSSLAVFRTIGAPHTVLASPPSYSGNLDSRRVVVSSLGYYNLHGLEDSPAWYGQRDPVEKAGPTDYPVAIAPEDLHRNGKSPNFIFSEACYGGHIFGKTEKESLALKFLSIGTQGVVASTCISYGSVSTPLIAADLLGRFFWQNMKTGRTAGEALMQAKVDLVREMNTRQGYLDGEDQKTLISFVLFGDPLASYDGFHIRPKTMNRSKVHAMVPVTSDNNQETISPAKVPGEVMKGVKQVVAEYLPGADVAGIQFCRLKLGQASSHPESSEKSSPSPQHGIREGLFAPAKKNKEKADRLVVSVSKQVVIAQHTHRHYLRVTLDESGKTIKVALSR